MQQHQKKILIVEDDRAIRESLAELLTSEGYEVVTAANGQEGLDCLTGCLTKLNLILLDLMMPIKDGFMFRQEQLLHPTHSEVPVVIMSADGSVVEKKKRTTAKAYLKKL